jgi:hypothetical protein
MPDLQLLRVQAAGMQFPGAHCYIGTDHVDIKTIVETVEDTCVSAHRFK